MKTPPLFWAQRPGGRKGTRRAAMVSGAGTALSLNPLHGILTIRSLTYHTGFCISIKKKKKLEKREP